MESLQIQCAHTNTIQSRFLELLPGIERCLRHAFRHLQAEAFEEALTEGKANCYVAFDRLCRTGRHERAFASSLARFAERQVNTGRKIGSRLNVREPLSRYAQWKGSFQVERLDRFAKNSHEWLESLVQDWRISVPDQAAFRIDLPAWLKTLSRRNQRIAQDLALGWSTREVAQKHNLSAARISQLRNELFESWQRFHCSTDKM